MRCILFPAAPQLMGKPCRSRVPTAGQERRRRGLTVRAEFDDSNKMCVPSDSFGGISPERMAAQQMQRFFTFVAVKIVLFQMEGVSPRSSLKTESDHDDNSNLDGKQAAERVHSDYEELLEFFQNVTMSDADEWLDKLLHRNNRLALRIMEVRSAYASEDFEWDNMKRLAMEGLADGNDGIKRRWVTKAFQAGAAGGS